MTSVDKPDRVVAHATEEPERLVPAEAGAPRVSRKPTSAAGVPAVLSSMAYTWKEAGTRGRALLRLNQQGGFDCPSCAWPDPKDRAVAEFCENGARAVADEATTKRVDRHFFATHSVAELLQRSDHWLNDQGRITEPMVRWPGAPHYEPISWDAAIESLAEHIRKLDSPDEAIFYTSGRASNEAAFLYQLFARELGTNNLPDCSNMCHESSGAGLGRSIGVGKGTVTLEDFDHADVIVVIGQNPGTNHPRMLSALQQAKKRGAKIISINPLEEVGLVRFKHPQKVVDVFGPGTKLCDLHLPVRVGGDLALLMGIQKQMLKMERERPGSVLDAEFLRDQTDGFAHFERSVLALDDERAVRDSGISLELMQRAAQMLASSKATICCWAMGITQHENGVANVQAVVNLLLMGGHFGRPGAGACPVRGHSNVQGDRTVGVWEVPPNWAPRMESEFGFRVPREKGFDVVASIQAMKEGRARVFFALGGNFLSATPDTAEVAEGLRKMEVTAHVSTKLNRAHLVTGKTAFILPCLGRTERDLQPSGPQFVTVENSMGIVSRSEGKLTPASNRLLSETRIVAWLAEQTLGPRSQVPWRDFADDYDRIRDAIERVVPGFERYNQRVREPNGFALPNPVREGRFPTRSGRGHFVVHPLPDLALTAGRFWLTTIRSHDQFNTTVYDLNDRYRGIFGHRYVVLMHPEDVEAHGLSKGRRVRIRSHFKGTQRSIEGFTVIPYDIPRGNVACYFPEANPLVPVDSHAAVSRTPTSKRVEVSIEALPDAVAVPSPASSAG
jgi:molybdopterin-dependent oxidoreductase alpha subunit